MKDIAQEELVLKLAALGDIDEEQKKGIACQLIGHSKIHTFFLGYHYCARCGDQVGDTLAGAYNAEDVVVVDHNYDKCRANYEQLTWKDKFMCPDPFASELEKDGE